GNIVFSAELHRWYRDQGLVSTSLHPVLRSVPLNEAYMGLGYHPSLVVYDVSYGAITQQYAGTSPDVVGLSRQISHFLPCRSRGFSSCLFSRQTPCRYTGSTELWTYMEEGAANLQSLRRLVVPMIELLVRTGSIAGLPDAERLVIVDLLYS
ncbi:hypothetical protein EDD15DRAFT_2159731, partial [Pisolithus albus]